jgi:hypothetical protein
MRRNARTSHKKNIPKNIRLEYYIAGCDASGGRNDGFTAAISHRERDGKIVLDVLYERRSPFNPSEVVALMRQYRCSGFRKLFFPNELLFVPLTNTPESLTPAADSRIRT